MRIIHIAPENFAGIPYRLMMAERKLGHDSRLITLMRHPRNLPEDITLNLPFIKFFGLNSLKKKLRKDNFRPIINKRASEIPIWKAESKLEELLIKFRDKLWLPKVKGVWKAIEGDKADLIILDGGHGFFKYDTFIPDVKAKKYAFYYGSDLRFRGKMPGIDEICEKKFTFEFDLAILDSELEFLFFPFDFSEIPETVRNHKTPGNKIIVGHAPTNRAAKGTDLILAVLEQLKKKFNLEIRLIENLPYSEALKQKSKCDFFIDQTGELGYGVNSVESLAMGIPTAVELLPDFEEYLYPHPFYKISEKTLQEDLFKAFIDKDNWFEKGNFGKRWVREKHKVENIVKKYLSYF